MRYYIVADVLIHRVGGNAMTSGHACRRTPEDEAEAIGAEIFRLLSKLETRPTSAPLKAGM
jgi:hypothetical protein